ncbi:spore germination protein GerW family protein [Pseudonocardia abyssalis]|uniref:Sporulation protein n=1 Tax=Pseudonocardia abyssalis TaxID=2792008 RepID=A0ABS6UPG1_9PSEU|nr:spore germination protein GerW family protein [Pseudonocardia abyssalis]MBW0116288.1 sporulation protein [Pseudonocardia abyssalis]MBW0133841.1 sporulation protein [Pseudonocardia abyssalis]
MDTTALVERVESALRVNRVFGEPVTVDGVTVIPVSHVGGGAGGGEGREVRADGETAPARPSGEGSGGGLGWTGHPCGVVVLRDGEARWLPALDVNRLVSAVAVVLVAGALAVRAFARPRS